MGWGARMMRERWVPAFRGCVGFDHSYFAGIPNNQQPEEDVVKRLAPQEIQEREVLCDSRELSDLDHYGQEPKAAVVNTKHQA